MNGKVLFKTSIQYIESNDIYPFQYNLNVFISFKIALTVNRNDIKEIKICYESCYNYYKLLNIGQIISLYNINNDLCIKPNHGYIKIETMSIRDCLLSPDDYYVTTSGIITSISKYIRIRDNSTSIELYCDINNHDLSNINIGKHIIITNSVIRSHFDKYIKKRYCYLKSTKYSKLIIIDDINDDILQYYDRTRLEKVNLWYINENINYTHQTQLSLPFLSSSEVIDTLYSNIENYDERELLQVNKYKLYKIKGKIKDIEFYNNTIIFETNEKKILKIMIDMNYIVGVNTKYDIIKELCMMNKIDYSDTLVFFYFFQNCTNKISKIYNEKEIIMIIMINIIDSKKSNLFLHSIYN